MYHVTLYPPETLTRRFCTPEEPVPYLLGVYFKDTFGRFGPDPVVPVPPVVRVPCGTRVNEHVLVGFLEVPPGIALDAELEALRFAIATWGELPTKYPFYPYPGIPRPERLERRDLQAGDFLYGLHHGKQTARIQSCWLTASPDPLRQHYIAHLFDAIGNIRAPESEALDV